MSSASDERTTVLDSGRRSFFQVLSGLYLSPGAEFVGVLRKPRVLLPLLVLVGLNLGFTAIWLQKVDPADFMKARLEESGQWDKIPPDARGQQLERGAGIFKVMGWVGAVLGAPIVVFVLSGIFFFVFRFFYGAELGFKHAAAVVAHTFLAVALVTTPLTLLILFLKGDWTLNPQSALQANLSMAVERGAVARPLYAVFESLDLFSFWMLWLLAVGFGVASRRTTGAAAGGVVGLWALYVIGKAGWAALF
jgi:hypothetical protein